jgi:2-succinyl-6-hydroxy-2,4-cyclohexadiene-1-carboxylate synthase
VADSAAAELLAESTEQEIGVGGSHDLEAMTDSLILLHGFTHTGASWQPVLAALGERYRGSTPDLPGHGAAVGRPARLDAVIEDVTRRADEAFTLVGYSMGGRLALHAALALGGRVRRLVLIGASPGIADRAERKARREADERLAEEIESSGIEEFARRWAQSTPVLAGQPTQVAEAVHEDRLRNTPAGLAAALRGLGTGALPSLWDRLHELSVPVILAVGERDEKFRAIAEQMAGRIAQARVVVVPGAGHAAHLEAPQAVARLLSVPAD